MRVLAGVLRRTAKLPLLVILAAGLALALTRDAQPVAASHTEIAINTSSTTASVAQQTIVFFPNDPPQNFYIWAKGVDNSLGAGAFNIEFHYDASVLSVTDLTEDTTWLASTGRSPTCPPPWWASTPPYVRPIPDDPNGLWEGKVGCHTTGPPPPFGPQGDGLLATLTLQPGSAPATTIVKFAIPNDNPLITYHTYLLDTGVQSGNGYVEPAEIPAVVRDLAVVIARCADFDIDPKTGEVVGNGVVRGDDILYVVLKFFTNDPLADLSEDGAVRGDDILIAVLQFFRDCPA